MNYTGDKKMKKGVLFLLLITSIMLVSGCNDFHTQQYLPIDNYGVETSIQDYNGRIQNLYLTEEKQLTTLSSPAYRGNFSVIVDNATNCDVGDAIDFWNDNNYFQGIIKGVSGNTITFISQLTTNFLEEDTTVKCGNWHLNVDGSTTKKTFYINPPNNKSWDVESLIFSFTDNADHDSGTFGSRTQLDNGFTGGVQNGVFSRYFLVVNNLGFKEQGFDYHEIEKAPSGIYGFTVEMLFEDKYGAIPLLDGTMNDKLITNVNDDLTSQTHIGANVRVHYKDE